MKWALTISLSVNVSAVLKNQAASTTLHDLKKKTEKKVGLYPT
jgi:hypothetical protein